jgi:hypothetical protein
MKNYKLTKEEVEIFTFFYQNQGKEFQLDFLCEAFNCSSKLILDCIEMWKTMVKEANQEFAQSQKNTKPIQFNLI